MKLNEISEKIIGVVIAFTFTPLLPEAYIADEHMKDMVVL